MDKTYLHQILSLALRAVREAREALGEERWRELEAVLLGGERPWHEAVLLPLGLAQEMVLSDAGLRERLDRAHLLPGDLERISELNLQACDLAALLPWNLTKGAYVFDPDLFRSLVGAPLDRLPVDLLTRLPEYAPLLVFPEPWQGGVGACWPSWPGWCSPRCSGWWEPCWGSTSARASATETKRTQEPGGGFGHPFAFFERSKSWTKSAS